MKLWMTWKLNEVVLISDFSIIYNVLIIRNVMITFGPQIMNLFNLIKEKLTVLKAHLKLIIQFHLT